MVKQDDKWTVTQAELCEVTGLSRKTIRELESDGLPHTGSKHRKRYDLRAVWTFCRERWDLEAGGNSDALERWRTARAAAAEFDLDVKRGRYISEDVATAWWTDRVTELRVAMQSMGQWAAGALAGMDPQAIRLTVHERCRQMMQNFSRQITAALEDDDENETETDSPTPAAGGAGALAR